MKKPIYLILGMFLIMTVSCRNKAKQDAIIVNSDSKYNNAYMYLNKYKTVFRNNTGIDSVVNEFIVAAGFGDSSNLNAFGETVGAVYMDGLCLGINHNPLITATYFYDEANINSGSTGKFDSTIWEVISPNGMVDMTHNGGIATYYKDTIPRIIRRDLGLTLRVDSLVAPNSDSVNVRIGAIDTTVSTSAGTLTLNPSVLAILPTINDWSYSIGIGTWKIDKFSVNKRGFNVSTYRVVSYHVNIN